MELSEDENGNNLVACGGAYILKLNLERSANSIHTQIAVPQVLPFQSEFENFHLVLN